jgi:hypothetical protein
MIVGYDMLKKMETSIKDRYTIKTLIVVPNNLKMKVVPVIIEDDDGMQEEHTIFLFNKKRKSNDSLV